MVKTLRSLRFLLTGPLILLMLVVLNWMTSPGVWWVQWAALGIGIAWVVSLLRVVRAAVLVGGLAALGAWVTHGATRHQGRSGLAEGTCGGSTAERPPATG